MRWRSGARVRLFVENCYIRLGTTTGCATVQCNKIDDFTRETHGIRCVVMTLRKNNRIRSFELRVNTANTRLYAHHRAAYASKKLAPGKTSRSRDSCLRTSVRIVFVSRVKRRCSFYVFFLFSIIYILFFFSSVLARVACTMICTVKRRFVLKRSLNTICVRSYHSYTPRACNRAYRYHFALPREKKNQFLNPSRDRAVKTIKRRFRIRTAGRVI